MFRLLPFIMPFCVLIIAPFYYFNKLRTKSQAVFDVIQKDILYQYIGQKVWFMGYDSTSKKNVYQIRPFKTLYAFYKADIYILSNQIMVFGKYKYFIKEISLIPFSIYIGEIPDIKSFTAFYTKFISASIVNGNLEIEFMDNDYPKNIKLFIKSLGEEILPKIPSPISISA